VNFRISDTVGVGPDGGQLTQLVRFAREHNLVRSVGRTAVCWGNAQAESFWATMKIEFYDR
jgi:transposase InsO family protein